ncbi:MAG: hypothetical protein WD423_09460 [Rhodothermales bacterium]
MTSTHAVTRFCLLGTFVFFLVAGAAAQELPTPSQPLHAGTATYVVTIAMGGQEMQMDVTHTIEDVDEGWRVTETAEGPMGTATDVEVLHHETLTPVSRTVTQGAMSIELAFSDSTVEGTITMQGDEQPVDVHLGGPIFSDGAAANLVLAALPLSNGYRAEYATLDLMQQQRKMMEVEVTGIDTTTVPAGSFETFRAEVSAVDGGHGGTTLWIDTETRLVVKAVATVPQLNGATLTSELHASSRLEE